MLDVNIIYYPVKLYQDPGSGHVYQKFNKIKSN